MRAPWNGFPEVAVHSSIDKLKSLPGYQAAKQGDNRAAARIAAALINPGRLNISIDYVVPVIQVDAGRYNAIPVAFAALLAKMVRCQNSKNEFAAFALRGRPHRNPGGLM